MAKLFKRAVHEPIRRFTDYESPQAHNDPAVVNQPQVVAERVRIFVDHVLQQAMVDDGWSFMPLTGQLLEQWLLPHPKWQDEHQSYTRKTKDTICKAVMQALSDYQDHMTGMDRDEDSITKVAAVPPGTQAPLEHVPAHLYHGTSLPAVIDILKDNSLVEGMHWGKPNEPHGPRLTINTAVAWEFALNYATVDGDPPGGGVVLELDGPALAKAYPLVEYHDTAAGTGESMAGEEDEVCAVTEAIRPITRFIKAIYIQPMTQEELATSEWIDGVYENPPGTFRTAYAQLLKHPKVKIQQAKVATKLPPAEGETYTPWDLVHIAAAEDDELADAIIAYVQANFQWSSRPDLRDRLLKILRKCPPTTKTLYRAEEPTHGTAPEGGQRGFRSWTVNHDTAVYLGNHMGPRNFAVRTTGGAPVKGLSINDFHYWHGRIHGYAGSGTPQAEYLVLDSSVPARAWNTDVRYAKMANDKTKKKRNWRGLSINIEHPAGTTRSGVAADGTKWEREMLFDYGYINE